MRCRSGPLRTQATVPIKTEHPSLAYGFVYRAPTCVRTQLRQSEWYLGEIARVKLFFRGSIMTRGLPELRR